MTVIWVFVNNKCLTITAHFIIWKLKTIIYVTHHYQNNSAMLFLNKTSHMNKTRLNIKKHSKATPHEQKYAQ